MAEFDLLNALSVSAQDGGYCRERLPAGSEVTEQDQGQLSDTELAINPPQTGNADVDDALLGLADLAHAPLAEHHDRLAKAHEALQEALDRDDDDRRDRAEPT